MSELVTHMDAHPDQELRKSAGHAYDVALGPHHPWLLRKTVGAAMLTLPYREKFLKDVSTTTAEEGMTILNRVSGAVRRTGNVCLSDLAVFACPSCCCWGRWVLC